MEAELVGVDLVKKTLVPQSLDHRVWSVDAEHLASESGADRARHRRREHEALDVLWLTAQHLLREVAEEGLGDLLGGELEIGRERGEADERGPALGLADERAHGLGGASAEHARGLVVGHRQLVSAELDRLVVEEAACGRPAGPAPRRHEDADRREREQPVEEVLDRGGLGHQVVVVEDDDAVARATTRGPRQGARRAGGPAARWRRRRGAAGARARPRRGRSARRHPRARPRRRRHPRRTAVAWYQATSVRPWSHSRASVVFP